MANTLVELHNQLLQGATHAALQQLVAHGQAVAQGPHRRGSSEASLDGGAQAPAVVPGEGWPNQL